MDKEFKLTEGENKKKTVGMISKNPFASRGESDVPTFTGYIPQVKDTAGLKDKLSTGYVCTVC